VAIRTSRGGSPDGHFQRVPFSDILGCVLNILIVLLTRRSQLGIPHYSVSCPKCAAVVSLFTRYCPNCNTDVRSKLRRDRVTMALIIFAGILLYDYFF